ncbi:hypothetical protein HYH03_000796 [Edaphochlamys debaryana]|uniref:Uncharacterized protein n=1 Tax=Edaphochlamys debaryana TaxID=47281 RepID=A0A835YNI7_9CHLO|nr:hypothetical protein HYH03_000796 [Edaphochlamys debaryana]|eukprot:KAG2500974.1 hypothetical protein HYH03_000796 [Edaphochlamys debaryana]
MKKIRFLGRAAALGGVALALIALSCSRTTASRVLKQQPAADVTNMMGFSGSPSRDALSGAVAAAGCTLDFFTLEAGLATALCPSGVTLSTATPGFADLGVNIVVEDAQIATGPVDAPPIKEDTATAAGVRISDAANLAYMSKALKGIHYAAQRKDKGGGGADIISFPFAGWYLDRASSTSRSDDGVAWVGLINKAIGFANKNGALVVVAAGNGYGTAVDVTAPGGNFWNRSRPCWGDDGVAVISSGTTMGWRSTPGIAEAHVAALAALYTHKAAMDRGELESELCNPNRNKTYLSPGQIKAAIMRGAVLPPRATAGR